MSATLSDNRTYFDVVQNYFLERTGRGLVLSSRDLELLVNWRRSGASAAIVCQGIDDAVETLRNGPRDLHACKKYVEPRLEQVHTLLRPAPAFAAPAPATSAASSTTIETGDDATEYFERLAEARESASRPEFRQMYAKIYARFVSAVSACSDLLTTAYEFDDLMVDEAYSALQTDERRRIDSEIESRFGNHLAMMPPEGREETIRASRRDILHKSFGLVGLVDG